MVSIKNTKTKKLALFSALTSLVFLVFPFVCQAGLKEVVNGVVGFFAGLIVQGLGFVASLIIKAIIVIAPYNDFIKEPSISQAWAIVRDISNMFFILILLLIAFATILRVETYNMKRWLPKLLIMAVLINFSKTICGIMIDFSQVIMLTFVNTFANTGGTFFDVLKLQAIVSAANDLGVSESGTAKAMDMGATVVAYLLACVFMLVAVIALCAILIAFLMRVIMLWILVALSPLAFMLSSFPQGQPYASRYWGEFTKYLVNGPVLAFFLWLALSVMGNFNQSPLYSDIRGMDLQAGVSQILVGSEFIPFVMAIGFLVGGLMISQQIGGVGANWGMSTVRNLGNKGLNVSKRAAKSVGKAAAYVPAQYAKRAGYGVGEATLGVLKRAPIIGNLAMKGQANLRMKREYAEEKDTRYLKYLQDDDLERLRQSYTGEGRNRIGQTISFLSRGMESSRQDYSRALEEKKKRGEYYGTTAAERTNSKTRLVLDSMRMAGVGFTEEGDFTWRNNDMGKSTLEFMKKNITQIDQQHIWDELLARRAQGTVGQIDPNNMNQLQNRWTNNNHFVDYYLARMDNADFNNLHHTILRDEDPNNPGVERYRPLQYLYDQQKTRQIARMAEYGKPQVRGAIGDWYLAHGIEGGAPLVKVPYAPAIAGGTAPRPGSWGILGTPRVIAGKTTNPEVASGITGLNNLEKGRLSLNFSDFGLDEKSAGLLLEGKDKAEFARRLRGSMSVLDENVAKSIEDRINSLSNLKLYNKGLGMTRKEAAATMAHEGIHDRINNTFSKDELRRLWSSLNEETRNTASSKIKKTWGNLKMSDDSIMDEYFAEGLTNKTRWRVDDPEKRIDFDADAETKINRALQSKGTNTQLFTSGLYKDKPSIENVKESVVNSVDPSLKSAMEQLVNAIGSLGEGLNSMERVARSMDDLNKTTFANRIEIEKNGEEFKNNTESLHRLASAID